MSQQNINGDQPDVQQAPTDNDWQPNARNTQPPWLALDMTKAAAVTLLAGGPTGAFVVRQSETHAGRLVLSYVNEGRVSHEYLRDGPTGLVALAGSPDMQFQGLDVLVRYFQSPRPQLPCPLRSDYLTGRAKSVLAARAWPAPMDRTGRTEEGERRAGGIAAERSQVHDTARRGSKDNQWLQLSLRSPDVIPMLHGVPDGTFIVHSGQGTRPGAAFVLTYAFGGSLHQQSITQRGDDLVLETYPAQASIDILIPPCYPSLSFKLVARLAAQSGYLTHFLPRFLRPIARAGI